LSTTKLSENTSITSTARIGDRTRELRGTMLQKMKVPPTPGQAWSLRKV